VPHDPGALGDPGLGPATLDVIGVLELDLGEGRAELGDDLALALGAEEVLGAPAAVVLAQHETPVT
jgi:hypothetical protein